ncbi:MAG: steroid 5-alpha reductase family enzyme [Bacillariaceae sp.]|jgi:steroid 5-alpha reductase family enzyme
MRRLSATNLLLGIIISSCLISPSLGFQTTSLKSALPQLHLTPPSSSSSLKLAISPSSSPATAPATSTTRLNAVPIELWTSILPPTMGFVKSEWIVSYGYGFGVALSALSLLLKQPQQPFSIATVHAAALLFYGFRLNTFLFIRNRLSSTYREIAKKIDEKSKERFSTRIARTPFVVSCGLLYYGLYLPVLLTSKLVSDATANSSVGIGIGMNVIKLLVGLQWFGYTIAAVGDLTKSYVKASEKNGKFLVTSGIYSFLRHPNFTGEILSWTCNSLAGTIAASYLLRNKFSFKILSYLGLSMIGWIGMIFVHLRATTNLEERQKKEYGNTDTYKKWIKNTWSGWKLGASSTKTATTTTTHEITMDEETQEDYGSGI